MPAIGFKPPRKGVLLSLGQLAEKYSFIEEASRIQAEFSVPLYATRGTAEVLTELGIECTTVEKTADEGDAVDLIERGEIDLVINVPRTTKVSAARTDIASEDGPSNSACRCWWICSWPVRSSKRCCNAVGSSSSNGRGRNTWESRRVRRHHR